MSELYLITGFLGAGKTTFLKRFIRLFAGRKMQLIVNEFGNEGVDGSLLAALGAYLNEISGGSVFCSCRMDQFEKVLRQSASIHPDVILVEASGLSDPTGVRKLFAQTDRFPDIQYQGAICLVDAVRFPKLYATARTCVKQLAAGDVVVVNKVDRASDAQRAQTLALIRGQRPDIAVVETSFGAVDAGILEMLAQARALPEQDAMLTEDLTLRKLLITVAPTVSPYNLQKFLEMFLEDTFRVKGFIQTSEGLYLADCVGNLVQLSPYAGAVAQEKVGRLVVLSGAGMPVKKRVKEAVRWYPEDILSVE
ncbi:CobW family GTP-binding protein [Anaeromassilibacillus senegalensis]|uniref:GTP-binding protein n=1 Tax=Anaeromassilibacillus senegalensis TaxID=1673717 RepID=A0ABS9CP79_9FIRM|nr:GTP-binding protein [Anaeromassilibacillus senegalensis]MCF2652186.1 GTP-binding protein [Anaeromassilibacillus senegalensis]